MKSAADLLPVMAVLLMLAMPAVAQTDMTGAADPAPPVPIATTSPEATIPAGTSVPVSTTALQPDAAEQQKYDEFIRKVATKGPSHIELRNEATFDLPEGYAFVPEKPAAAIMKRFGNNVGDDFLGMVVPVKDESWFVVVAYEPAGHVSDEDAKNWDADKLLKQIRDGTEAQNEKRRNEGLPETDVIGWIEKPHYDPMTHRLVWSIASRNRGAPESDQGVNYMTMLLGRVGFVSMTMVASVNTIDALKPVANDLLGRLNFSAGRGYSDFDSKTDKVAEYGLAALVAGVAAKKLGLFAIAAAFVVKFAKVGILAVVAFFAALRKKRRGGGATEVAAVTSSTLLTPTLAPPTDTTSTETSDSLEIKPPAWPPSEPPPKG